MKLLQKIFQNTYIIGFVVYVFMVAGNTNAEKDLPLYINIIGMICTLLTMGKMLYLDLKGE